MRSESRSSDSRDPLSVIYWNSSRRRSRTRRFSLEQLEGRILPATFTAFTLPATALPPANITKGPDGNLWFTEPGMPTLELPGKSAS